MKRTFVGMGLKHCHLFNEMEDVLNSDGGWGGFKREDVQRRFKGEERENNGF